MRQLNATGWMHNRLRMIIAAFLTKDLLISWQWGERYFMQQLLDADLASEQRRLAVERRHRHRRRSLGSAFSTRCPRRRSSIPEGATSIAGCRKSTRATIRSPSSIMPPSG